MDVGFSCAFGEFRQGSGPSGVHQPVHRRCLPVFAGRRSRRGRRRGPLPGIRHAILARQARAALRLAGRFRNYVKTVLVNLVNDFYRAKGRGEKPLDFDPGHQAPFDTDEVQGFISAWREEVLNQTWQTLREQNPVFEAVLRTRIENPDFSVRQVADHLVQLGSKQISPANVRKTLERARSNSPTCSSTKSADPCRTNPTTRCVRSFKP